MIKWQWLPFNELTPRQLYDALQLRESIFTLMQKCTECDVDGADPDAVHLFGYDDQSLAAYLRVLPKIGKQYIGRIVVNPDYQGKGLGREMMQHCLHYLEKHFPDQAITMSAQTYLIQFYESLGFKTVGDTYLDGGIPHIDMVLSRSL